MRIVEQENAARLLAADERLHILDARLLDQSMLPMDHSMMSAPSALAIATVLCQNFGYGGRM